MRFIVDGAGVIGGVVGARLAQHGHDVALIARRAHLDIWVSRVSISRLSTPRSRHETVETQCAEAKR